jgi:hypothetical protein
MVIGYDGGDDGNDGNSDGYGHDMMVMIVIGSDDDSDSWL